MNEKQDVFCPQCAQKMGREMISKIQADIGMPTCYVIQMAIGILQEAGCPNSIIRPIFEWAKQYGQNTNQLNEYEQDRLRLLKWKQWADTK